MPPVTICFLRDARRAQYTLNTKVRVMGPKSLRELLGAGRAS